tara:strand:- start:109 stop:450 length:342 start_codon:yes stop_codon:yes gene_type:complete
LNYSILNTFYKRKILFVFLLLFNFLFIDEIFASQKRSIISGFEVKVYKKERKHIETSALLCALAINGNPLKDIKNNLKTTFKKPISKSDQFLLVDTMSTMCPEIDNRKIFENK